MNIRNEANKYLLKLTLNYVYVMFIYIYIYIFMSIYIYIHEHFWISPFVLTNITFAYIDI
jgi:hypothetical protein